MRVLGRLAVVLPVLWASLALAAESPVGTWQTVDDKTGKVRSEVQIYDEGGKLKVRGYLGLFYKTQTWLKGK